MLIYLTVGYLTNNIKKKFLLITGTNIVEYLIKETGRDTSKWKAILHPQTGKKSIVKMAFLPKMVYRYNAVPFQMSTKTMLLIKEQN